MRTVYHYCALTTYGAGNMAYRDGLHRVEDDKLDVDALRASVAADFVPPREAGQVVFISLTKIS